MNNEEQLEEYQKVLPSEGIISIGKLAKYFSFEPAQLYDFLMDKNIPVLRFGTKQDDGLIDMKDIYKEMDILRSKSLYAGRE